TGNRRLGFSNRITLLRLTRDVSSQKLFQFTPLRQLGIQSMDEKRLSRLDPSSNRVPLSRTPCGQFACILEVNEQQVHAAQLNPSRWDVLGRQNFDPFETSQVLPHHR